MQALEKGSGPWQGCLPCQCFPGVDGELAVSLHSILCLWILILILGGETWHLGFTAGSVGSELGTRQFSALFLYTTPAGLKGQASHLPVLGELFAPWLCWQLKTVKWTLENSLVSVQCDGHRLQGLQTVFEHTLVLLPRAYTGRILMLIITIFKWLFTAS